MLSQEEIEATFERILEAARRKLRDGDLENATRSAAVAHGLAVALDDPDRKLDTAEFLSRLAMERSSASRRSSQTIPHPFFES